MQKTGLSQYLLIDEEKRAGKGEDSHVLWLNQDFSLLAVLDGSGGSGGRCYTEYGGLTGARIASGVMADVLLEWAGRQTKETISSSTITEEWTSSMKIAFAALVEHEKRNMKIGGKLLKEFPTTLAAAVIRENAQGGYIVDILWAGDSRVYLLDAGGLHQLTLDDIREQDAFRNISNDAPMTNLLCAEGFEIHHYAVKWNGIGLIFAASDGAFGYLPSPMHFEGALLESLETADSMEKWETSLRNKMLSVTMDDTTVCGALYGMDRFSDLRNYYQKRLQQLRSEYLIPAEEADEERLTKLWETYRKNYELAPDRFRDQKAGSK